MEKNKTIDAFQRLTTREDVAQILGIRDVSLRYFLYKIRPENMYTSFSIPKKDGTMREIYAPDKRLKKIQQKLAALLVQVYNPKACAYGFIPGKNILQNAQQHTNKRLILNIDLKDFFTQVHFGRVRGMLMKKPYSIGEEAATTIAQIACRKGFLPQGAPSSPIITNMICAPLDNALMKLAKQTGCMYTRYADDISFSTYSSEFDRAIVYTHGEDICLGDDLLNVLNKNSFAVNPNKITLRPCYTRQEVTGLTVNKFPNVRRSFIKQLRAILHNCEVDGLVAAANVCIQKGYCHEQSMLHIATRKDAQPAIEDWFKRFIKGKVLYLKQIKGAGSLTYLSYAQKANKVFGEEVFDVSLLKALERIAIDNTYILEYEGEHCGYKQGSAFYLSGIGLVTSYHVTEGEEFFRVYSFDAYSSTEKTHLGVIGTKCKELGSDKAIDYAIYAVPQLEKRDQTLEIGDSRNLRIGEQVIIMGYPEHIAGNSPYVQTCSITSKKTLFGMPLYTVSGRIAHGASGGVVLNANHQAIGIIKGGIVDICEDSTEINQGFVPLYLALDHFNKLRTMQKE